jgi:hypothetical protein
MNTKKGQFEPAEVGKLFAKHFSTFVFRDSCNNFKASIEKLRASCL